MQLLVCQYTSVNQNARCEHTISIPVRKCYELAGQSACYSVPETLPDALQTGCEKCSDKQKGTSERVIRHLIQERSKDWERLLAKFDPKGEYRKRYEAWTAAGTAAA